jgi:hypothetical protein
MRLRAHLAAAVILFALLAITDGGAIHAGFTADDDPGLLAYAMAHPLAQYAFDPTTWQSLSWANFTPWLVLDFNLDFRLFGIHPVGFYVHHLILVGGCAWLLYLLLQRFMKAPWAILGAILFLLSTPVTVVAYQLMARHYVTGLFFCLIAILSFLRSLAPESSSHRGIWLAISTAAYLGALLNKEIFALLPLPLFFLPQQNWRLRVTSLVPFVGVAVVYLAWRSWMLGSPVGAYSTPGSWALPGPLSVQLVAVVGLAVWAGTFGDRPRFGDRPQNGVCPQIGVCPQKPPPASLLLFAAAIMIATLLPLIPVHAAVVDTPRYGLIPAAVFSAATVFILSALASGRRRWGRLLAWFIVGVLAVRAGEAADRESAARALQSRQTLQQDQPFWNDDGSVLVWLPATVPSWHVEGIETIRHLRNPAATTPQFIYDPIQLPHLRHGFRTLLRLQTSTGAYVPEDRAGLRQRLAIWCQQRRALPLEVNLTYDDASKVMRWHLGPETSGQYQLVVVDGGVLPVPPEHAVRLLVSRPQLYVRYDSPGGALTYSDMLTLPRQGSLHWSRPAAAPSVEPVAACVAATLPADAL